MTLCSLLQTITVNMHLIFEWYSAADKLNKSNIHQLCLFIKYSETTSPEHSIMQSQHAFISASSGTKSHGEKCQHQLCQLIVSLVRLNIDFEFQSIYCESPTYTIHCKDFAQNACVKLSTHPSISILDWGAVPFYGVGTVAEAHAKFKAMWSLTPNFTGSRVCGFLRHLVQYENGTRTHKKHHITCIYFQPFAHQIRWQVMIANNESIRIEYVGWNKLTAKGLNCGILYTKHPQFMSTIKLFWTTLDFFHFWHHCWPWPIDYLIRFLSWPWIRLTPDIFP